MTNPLAADFARGLDEVLASAIPLDVLLRAASADELPPSADLQKIDDLGLRSIGLPASSGGLDLDPRTIGLLGWVAGRRLLPSVLRDEALIGGPCLAAVGPQAMLDDFLAYRLNIAVGSFPEIGRGTPPSSIEALSRPEPVVAVHLTDTGAAAAAPVSANVSLRQSHLDPGQGGVTVEYGPDREWVSSPSTVKSAWTWHVFMFAELLGICEAVTRMSADHASSRSQFGRPIAAFQAVRHMLANMHTDTELVRSAVSQVCDSDATTASDPFVRSLAASLPAAARSVCETAIQVHGGMGFTWEYGLHLYYRRSLAIQARLGGQHMNDRLVGAALLDEGSNRE
jgi:hypothetical protein